MFFKIALVNCDTIGGDYILNTPLTANVPDCFSTTTATTIGTYFVLCVSSGGVSTQTIKFFIEPHNVLRHGNMINPKTEKR